MKDVNDKAIGTISNLAIVLICKKCGQDAVVGIESSPLPKCPQCASPNEHQNFLPVSVESLQVARLRQALREVLTTISETQQREFPSFTLRLEARALIGS